MAQQRINIDGEVVEDIYRSLVENALDFIESGIENLEKRPKNGLVDFYTAIELFLKARLLKEHWTLVITKPDLADSSKFLAGNFQSVTLEMAAKRLNNVANDPISRRDFDIFDSLRKHRNQIVHFKHDDFTPEFKTGVLAEQLQAWGSIYNLLTEIWKPHFNEYLDSIDIFHTTMIANRNFLKAQYDLFVTELNAKAFGSAEFIHCDRCDFQSAEVISRNVTPTISCKVCSYQGDTWRNTVAKINCPNCSKDTFFLHADISNCLNCRYPISEDERIELCKIRYSKDNPWSDPDCEYPVECSHCENSKPSVFYIFNEWSCVACFDRGASIGECDSCERNIYGDILAAETSLCAVCLDKHYALEAADLDALEEFKSMDLDDPDL